MADRVGIVASALVAAAVVVVLGAGAAQAEDVNLSGGSIGSDSGAATPCNTTPDNKSVLTRYDATTQRYDIGFVRYTSVSTDCRGAGEFLRFTISDNIGSLNALPDGVLAADVVDAASNNYAFPAGSGPLLDDINNTNSQVAITVVLVGSG